MNATEVRNVLLSDHPGIQCFDNGGATFDRYTVVYLSQREGRRRYAARGMSERPTSPNGFGQWTSAMLGAHLGKRVNFEQLPAECQAVVVADCMN